MDSSGQYSVDSSRPPSRWKLSRTKHAFTVSKLLGFCVIAALAVLIIVVIGLIVTLMCTDRQFDTSDLSGPSSDPSNSTKGQSEVVAYRLPRTVLPMSYNVSLQPSFIGSVFNFDGNVTIELYCNQSTSNITFHINDLDLFNDTIRLTRLGNASQVLELSHFVHNVDQQLFSVVLSQGQVLEPGNSYSLDIRFRGRLNDELAGFYRSAYNDSAGQKSWLAVTQFQPTDARRAFPCFDEPGLKATFNITLIHWNNMTALSNMPIKLTEDRGDWIVDHFETTVRMSTYLLAFVVGNLSYIEDTTASPRFRIWSRPGNEKASELALFMGPKVLKYYEDFFDIPFPLPKTDMVAVPDFNAGAMENWGLITYRETALLYDPEVAATLNLQRVATVVAHELAHQWFGNLVTPKWWDDLWLNEGFASYMEYQGVNSVFPDWKMNEQFVVDEVQDVFELDCLTSSHPISVTVNHPDEINEIFDRISYGKGSSIIRMMNYLLGAESFQLGVSNYLKAMKFENADQDDLWNHLTEAQSLNQSSILEVVDVKNVMDSWTLQAGYPVVTLSRNYSTGMASVRQERFLLNHLNQSVDNSNYSWEIPVTYTTRSVAFEDQWSPVTKLWLHKEAEKEISTAGIASAGDWMIANVQQVGYYRVNYDQVNWQLIIDQLRHNHSRIHVNNRAQIVDDSLDLARAGLVDYAIPLEICRYLVNETDHVPWEAATAGFTFLDLMLRRTALYGQWKEFALALTSALYDRVGWEIAPKEDVLRQYVQETALSWACKYNHQGCIEKARTLFTDWKSSVIKQANNTIYPNWRQFVYCTAIKHGTEQDWSFLWSVYTQTQDASERDKLMGALACSKQPWILRRYITWAFTENGYIRRQDGSTVFRAVAANDYGRDLAYSYLQENWNSIVKYYGKSFFSFGSLVKAVTSSLTTDYEVTELKKFYETVKHNVGTAQRSFLQAIEKAEANADWTNNYYARIESWLTENGATVA